MLTLRALAALADAHADEIARPVAPVLLGDRIIDTDSTPLIMGTINLSRDSTYRESIAISTDSAVRKARVMAAEGAALIDIGAESSTAAAARVSSSTQIDGIIPVVEQLAAEDIAVSVETYDPDVARAALKAGAKAINLTGSAEDDAIFELAAAHDALVVMCYVNGANVREVSDASNDAVPALIAHFEPRIARAHALGADRLVIDPGLGFFYGNLTVPAIRARYQARVLLSTFRLRRLGLPVCHALPHAFDLFEEQYREAEGFFAVLAALGGTGVFRTHQVASVSRVLRAMHELDAAEPDVAVR